MRRNLLFAALACAAMGMPLRAQQNALNVRINPAGEYSIGLAGAGAFALTSGVAAEVNGRWLRSTDYPHHEIRHSDAEGYLGRAEEWQVTNTGLGGEPDLLYVLRAYTGKPFADLVVSVRNSTAATIHVQAIRAVDASGGTIPELGGPATQDRVLSDSFSEDRPAMQIHDLSDATLKMQRAVGCQLVYNRESRQSIFAGALTSDRFLTILRLHIDNSSGASRVSSWEADSTGTTELEVDNSLRHSPAQDRIELRLPVLPGEEMASERMLLSVGTDYHAQLETYGALIRQIHHARTSAPPLMGWWSWTAYYFGLNQGAALANAEWESEHLRSYGYNLFHIDEGYQYARGEYITPNATVFPNGLAPVEYEIRGLGLTPGIWTAPFEVSSRSQVYQNHRDWLVKNAQGEPIHAGSMGIGKDDLYVLDTTNPGAQEYLRETYTKMVNEWGIHYIKLDFMDDTAIEGYHYKPDTTAMEAQRIGLKIIRDAVGENVFLDKDGSVMMNPVGYVDYGRISQDTGHTFEASRAAATGIASRYYMNRNFFVADPDAFAVSTQTIPDQSWHESTQPATLSVAQVSIALAAVSGGMFEIGDNLPSLENSPGRLALIENQELIDMIRLGRASIPVDLMSYARSDGQPSIFYLAESGRQSILTVFNWTEHAAVHTIRLADLGLSTTDHYLVTDVMDGKPFARKSPAEIQIELPPHSVRVLKIVNQDAPVQPPVVTAVHASEAESGKELAFTAQQTSGDPVLKYHWNFGDGIEIDGPHVIHAWTEPGEYTVRLTANGLDDTHVDQTFPVRVTGTMPTTFTPALIKRFEPKENDR